MQWILLNAEKHLIKRLERQFPNYHSSELPNPFCPMALHLLLLSASIGYWKEYIEFLNSQLVVFVSHLSIALFAALLVTECRDFRKKKPAFPMWSWIALITISLHSKTVKIFICSEEEFSEHNSL
jgi:hypothetical protein